MAKDRRRKILKAAETLVGSRRFHEVTMDAIAHAAGVGKGTIYRYFDDKESLFAELADFGFEELCAKIGSEPAATAPFADNLIRICESISGFFLRRRALMRIMNEAEDREACGKTRIRAGRLLRRQRLHDVLAGVLAEGVTRGEISGEMPLDQLALFLLSMLRGRVRHGSRSDTEVPIANVIALFLDGCRPKERS